MSSTPEEYHTTSDDESPETGTSYEHETGEVSGTPHDRELLESDDETGNPNASTSAGLEGDMGLSSERTGPADEVGTGGLGDLDDFQGTGTVGSARSRTHGMQSTTGGPAQPEAPGRDAAADAGAVEGDDGEVRRTVGESNTAEVPSHPLGNKNPGHSGGTPGQHS